MYRLYKLYFYNLILIKQRTRTRRETFGLKKFASLNEKLKTVKIDELWKIEHLLGHERDCASVFSNLEQHRDNSHVR